MEEQIQRTETYIYYQGQYVLITPYVYNEGEWKTIVEV